MTSGKKDNSRTKLTRLVKSSFKDCDFYLGFDLNV